MALGGSRKMTIVFIAVSDEWFIGFYEEFSSLIPSVTQEKSSLTISARDLPQFLIS